MSQLADHPELEAARARLADEWRARDPRTPADIAEFYRTATGLQDDLDEWHATPARKQATELLVQVAKMSEAKVVVDIGAGAGHDLKALRDATDAELWGVELNVQLWNRWSEIAYPTHLIEDAPIERADLLVCMDVLEHVPDPESFLSGIATRAKVGALLFEATATHDDGTPLHLKDNRGWHPGRCLESNGWWIVDRADRIRVWERKAETGTQHASILACIYRSMSPATHDAILELLLGNTAWRERVKSGDGLIPRSRSIITSSWWAETSDDVFLMVDDDVTFSRQDAERLVELCRNGYDIICGAYPVHNGEHFALKMLPGMDTIEFGAGEPIEIRYAATGFLAVHRKVIDALIPTMPLCQPWSYWPLFQTLIVQDENTGDHTQVSEDWGFCELARRLGFKIWLDPQAILDHASQIPVSVRNMGLIRQAIKSLHGDPMPAQEERNGQGH